MPPATHREVAVSRVQSPRGHAVARRRYPVFRGVVAAFFAGTLSARAAEASPLTITADAGRVIHTMQGGFGASWHALEQPIPVEGDRSHGGSAWGGNPPADDEAAWRQIYRHADWLGFDFVRVEVEQRMWEPEQGRYTWNAPEMRILYRILDWCERRRARVFLQNMWGNVAWNTFPEFGDDPIQRVHSGPRSREAFADSLAALVKHLTRTRRYTCLRWLCINNEPGYDWSWWQRPPNDPMPLRDGLAAVRAALDREGLSLPLSGPDWTDLPALQPERVDFDEFIGAYDLHSYYANFDWRREGGGYPLRVAEERLRAWTQWAQGRGKPLFLSEVGTMVFGWRTNHPGPATFGAALKDAELVVRALNLGVDGFNRWSFINRGDLDGQWQMIDTWDPALGALRPRIVPKPNAYFVYGLISRLTVAGSRVVACAVNGGLRNGTNRVFAAALLSPKGRISWLIVNDGPETLPATLTLQAAGRRPLYRYQVHPGHRDQPDLQIDPAPAVTPAGDTVRFHCLVAAESLTVLSHHRLAHGDRGLTVE